MLQFFNESERLRGPNINFRLVKRIYKSQCVLKHSKRI